MASFLARCQSHEPRVGFYADLAVCEDPGQCRLSPDVVRHRVDGALEADWVDRRCLVDIVDVARRVSSRALQFSAEDLRRRQVQIGAVLGLRAEPFELLVQLAVGGALEIPELRALVDLDVDVDALAVSPAGGEDRAAADPVFDSRLQLLERPSHGVARVEPEFGPDLAVSVRPSCASHAEGFSASADWPQHSNEPASNGARSTRPGPRSPQPRCSSCPGSPVGVRRASRRAPPPNSSLVGGRFQPAQSAGQPHPDGLACRAGVVRARRCVDHSALLRRGSRVAEGLWRQHPRVCRPVAVLPRVLEDLKRRVVVGFDVFERAFVVGLRRGPGRSFPVSSSRCTAVAHLHRVSSQALSVFVATARSPPASTASAVVATSRFATFDMASSLLRQVSFDRVGLGVDCRGIAGDHCGAATTGRPAGWSWSTRCGARTSVVGPWRSDSSDKAPSGVSMYRSGPAPCSPRPAAEEHARLGGCPRTRGGAGGAVRRR